MSAPSIDAAALLRAWREKGLVAEADVGAITAALAEDRAEEAPLHLKILAAVGTLFATGFFLSFLALAKIVSFDSGAGLLGWGVGFLGAGTALSLAQRPMAVGLGRDLVAQVAFVALALGKVALVVGAVLLFGAGTHWVVTLALLAVTVATYPVSGASLDRFLSSYAAFASLLFEILERDAAGPVAPALALFQLVATVTAAGLLLPHRVPTALRPIGTAALAAMGTVVAILASGHDFGLWANGHPIDPRPISAMLALSLAGAIVWAARETGAAARVEVAAAAGGALLLGLAGAPGVVFALLLLVVGHARHDTPIRVVGILALPVFLVLWYWARDLDFLVKSAVLVASGGLLLGARGAMALLGWDRETSP